MARVTDLDGGQWVSVGIGIVTEDTRFRHGKWGILVCGIGVIHCDRRGVSCIDGDRDSGRIGIVLAVVGLVGKVIAA